MKTTKHFALVALLGLAVALCASTSVLAQGGKFRLINVGDEPRAAGSFTLTWWWEWWNGGGDPVIKINYLRLDVSCTKLTPGATYLVTGVTDVGSESATFVAQKGTKSGEVHILFLTANAPPPRLISTEVYRVDSADLVRVLAWPTP